MTQVAYYQSLQERADSVKHSLLKFLIERKQEGYKVVAYGAAAKGNTLLNYCGVKADLIEFGAHVKRCVNRLRRLSPSTPR